MDPNLKWSTGAHELDVSCEALNFGSERGESTE
jgi:hypothetical protein